MQLIIPIGAIFVEDFLQDVLQGFICRLDQAIGLRVVWRAFLVNHRVMCCKFPDNPIEEMGPLVTDELDRADKTAP